MRPQNQILFGPSGNSDSFYAQGNKHTWQAFSWIRKRGLSAFEYSFGRGVSLSQETAELIGRHAADNSITVSAHAPYYINLAAAEQEKLEKGISYILETALRLRWMGGQRMVVHVGSAMKMQRQEALENCARGLDMALERLSEAGLSPQLCIETMGKPGQIGDLDEILQFCKRDARLTPCVDFAHLHALGGGCLNQPSDFARVLDQMEEVLGTERARNIHIHFSTVEFGEKGEKKHMTFADTMYGPRFEHLALLLAQRRYTPHIICESRGTMAEDARTMRDIYESAVRDVSSGKQEIPPSPAE